MNQILVYVSDMERPINIVAQEIIEGAEEGGIGRPISFKDVKGREGMVLLNPEKVAAVIITPADEPG